MLVEGGYLHAMKQIIEKAAETPDPPRPGSEGSGPGDPHRRSGIFNRSLKKITSLLRRDAAAP
jgi:hypothetical protein